MAKQQDSGEDYDFDTSIVTGHDSSGKIDLTGMELPPSGGPTSLAPSPEPITAKEELKSEQPASMQGEPKEGQPVIKLAPQPSAQANPTEAPQPSAQAAPAQEQSPAQSAQPAQGGAAKINLSLIDISDGDKVEETKPEVSESVAQAAQPSVETTTSTAVPTASSAPSALPGPPNPASGGSIGITIKASGPVAAQARKTEGQTKPQPSTQGRGSNQNKGNSQSKGSGGQQRPQGNNNRSQGQTQPTGQAQQAASTGQQPPQNTPQGQPVQDQSSAKTANNEQTVKVSIGSSPTKEILISQTASTNGPKDTTQSIKRVIEIGNKLLNEQAAAVQPNPLLEALTKTNADDLDPATLALVNQLREKLSSSDKHRQQLVIELKQIVSDL